MAKKPMPLSQMFVGAHQSHEVLTLKDRVTELEDEIAQLRGSATGSDSALLEQRIEELTQQLAERGGVHDIPIAAIYPDPDQPRTIFPPAVIEARAKSLREDGQLTPIILIPLDNGTYRLFEGALRHLAAPLAGISHLQAVFRTEQEDAIEVFDRQLTTSIQSEKLHGLDLAKALLRLITHRYPELQPAMDEVPGLLNAAIQRLKRAKQLSDLDRLQTAPLAEQQQWIETADLRADEKKIVQVILGKQLNPSSINTNIFPLLKLPGDIQGAMCQGLEASKARELAKLTPDRLGLAEKPAIALRQKLADQAVQEQWSLSMLQQKIQEKVQAPLAVASPKLEKTIQKVQALKIEVDEDVDEEVEQAELKRLERALQEKLKQVRSLLRSRQS